ncbi:hypothetical protein V1506DRAFT_549914 [Lipomyces tetrasporus]
MVPCGLKGNTLGKSSSPGKIAMFSGYRMIWFYSLRKRSIFRKVASRLCWLFCFDQSSNHQAPDALAIRKFTLKDKKMNDPIKAGYFELNGQRYVQEMCYTEGHPKFGWQKGIRTILEERQLWHDKLPRLCQKKAAEIDLSQTAECCATHLLALQEDFLSQPSRLEIAVRSRGHLFINVSEVSL